MSIRRKSVTVCACDNCGAERDGLLPSCWMEWWEKDGMNKSRSKVEGWRHLHNCPACIRFGVEMAEVMG